MKIYDKNGIELIDINVSDESYRQRAIMESPTLTLYFDLNAFMELPVGAYADFEDERFYLFDTANFTKNSTKAYSYTLILHGIQEKLSRFRFYDFANGGLIFSLTAKPLVHIEMLVNVLNAKDSGWTVGTVTDASEIVLSYSHNSCLEALAMICDECELEYEITSGKVINLRKTEYNKATPLSLAYGQGNGLKPGIERKNDDNARPVERLYVQGGERNIDFSTYNSKYLLLPKSQELIYQGRTYATDAAGLYIQRTDKAIDTAQEGSLDASSIYPSRVGVVTAVEVIDEATNLYNFVDATIPAALDFDEYLIAGETLAIVFQSGMLTGKEFEVKYVHEFRRFELVPKEIDGYNMPSATWAIEVGDTYAVFGCSFPDAYVSDDATKTGASWDMFREAVQYLYENEEENYSYGGQLSPIWLAANWAAASAKLRTGGYCSLTDPELGDVLIRIRSIKDMVNNRYDVTIDLSNALVEPSITTQLARLNSYTASLTIQRLTEALAAAQAAGQNVNYLTEIINNLNTSWSDLSGLPTDNEALKAYLDQIGGGSVVDTSSRILSGTVLWFEGLKYKSTLMSYLIFGIPYSALPRDGITLPVLECEAADANLPRVDTVYLDTFSNINIRTGVPAENPVAPTLGANELFVTYIYIAAGALEPTAVDIEKVYDEGATDGSEWEATVYTDAGKTGLTVTATDEPLVGTKHLKMTVAVPDEVLVYPQHYLGEAYQGGKIFWIDPASGGKKGLIAALTDTASDALWSRLSDYSVYATNGRATAIGTGAANTAAMLATPAAAGQAIKFIDELSVDGYADWYMGSRDEMVMLRTRQNYIGGFNSSKSYWTSTEFDWDEAICLDWWNGRTNDVKKNGKRAIRAIRTFDDTTLPASAVVESYAPADTAVVFSAGGEFPIGDAIISFNLKHSNAFRTNSIVLIELYLGAVRVGSCAMSPVTSLFGFKPEVDDYQLVAIGIAQFVPTKTKIDAIKVSFTGAWNNNATVYIDDMRFQYTDVTETGKTIQQVPELVLSQAGWAEVNGVWQYQLNSAKIADNSIVDVIPLNEDADVISAAGIYPETISAAGFVLIFAANKPTADIRITITIMEASV